MANIKVINQKNESAVDTRLSLSVYDTKTVMLSPSVSSAGGVRKYTYLTFDRPSRFPTDASGNYNEALTYINFQTGVITGGYKVANTFTPVIPATNTSVACAIQLDDQDRLYFNYGVAGTLVQVQNAIANFIQDGTAGSLSLDRSKALIWIVIVSSTDGLNISTLANTSLVDCRSFHTENKPDATHALHNNPTESLKNEYLLIEDVAASATSCRIITNSQGIRAGDQLFLQSNGLVSSSVYADLFPFGEGAYNIRPASEPGSNKALKRSTGNDWVLTTDFAYGDNLANVPLVGSKVYGSNDGITIYDGQTNLLSLEPQITAFARNLSSFASFVPENYEVAIDPDSGYIKFGTQLIVGDGRHGVLNLSTPGSYSLNQNISGNF